MQNLNHDCQLELKEHGLKITPARLGVLKALEEASLPLDTKNVIDGLAAQNIKADKATVFRILNTFSTKGLVHPIQLREGKMRYEHNSIADHHHLVCESCGEIEDIACFIEIKPEAIKNKKNFKVKYHALELYGTCKNCHQ